MEATEIILIIIGIVLIFLSCIFTGNKKENEGNSSFSGDLSEEDKKKLEEYINKRIENITEERIVNFDDDCSKITNEKIMAINEFAEPLTEKIQENNDHVLFLYNMLNQKDDEIKQTLADMENAKSGIKETTNDVLRLTRQLNAAIKKTGDKPAKVETKATEPVVQAPVENPQTEPEDTREDSLKSAGTDRNQAILKEYRAGKNVLEISRELNIGQGEVKLVIDLFG